MEDLRFDSLSAGQKECLRLYHARWEIKEIARHVNRSAVTVNQRLALARKHLGVTRSAEAARLLAEYEAGAVGIYSPPIYRPEMVGTADIEVPIAPGGEELVGGFPWPFPTASKPTNDLNFGGKLAAALVLAALIVLTFGGAVAALSGLSELL